MGIWNRLLGRLAKRPAALKERDWTRLMNAIPATRRYDRAERARLRALAEEFLRKKNFDPVAGLALSDIMRAHIALKACVPILNLDLSYFRNWRDIVVYPGEFRVHGEHVDESGVAHRYVSDLCGQSLAPGPMVLSWQAIEEDLGAEDCDLVIHECAHKLDALNGEADGYPPLHADMNAKQWARAWRRAYDEVCDAVDEDLPLRIDPYAATDPAECFAVMSETFFTAPRVLRADFPGVYEQLSVFFRQEPLRDR